MRSPEKLAENIRFHSLRVPKIGWLRTLYQGCIRATRKKMRELQPDIVHGQGTERDCAISAALSGFPNVVTVHGNMKAIAEFYDARPLTFFWLAGKLETLALRRTGGVFCNSAYTEHLESPRAERTWRVTNPLRSQFFSPLPPPARNPRPILLNIGMLEPRKQQVEILAAAKNLWRRGFRFEIQFAGDANARTDYRADFFRALADAEKEGHARHLGVLPVEQLVSAMDAADALVHFPTEESFGLVVAEALARNLKLFAASVGGIVDIASGVEGVELPPANDFAALENSLGKWIQEGAFRPAKAREAMRGRYAPEIIARRHVEIYQEVLNTRS